MKRGRRDFLKIAGLGGGLAAAGGGPLLLRAAFGSGPRPGKGPARQWGMIIDTRKCLASEGCRDCQTACHAAHNVPHIEGAAHEVKWLWPEPYKDVFVEEMHEYAPADKGGRPVLVTCNHCANPPCTRACPTSATWQRDDGVVMMDWHRCIGCRYCAVACPYGARSFNWVDPRKHLAQQNPEFPTRTKGVVDKCLFCYELLDEYPKRQPLCVEACQRRLGVANAAIIFGDLNDPSSEIRRVLAERDTLQRKPAMGTRPKVFYIV